MIKVVCIKDCDNNEIADLELYGVAHFVYVCREGRIYYQNTYHGDVNWYGKLYIAICEDSRGYVLGSFDANNFVLLSDYRDKQINDILDGD